MNQPPSSHFLLLTLFFLLNSLQFITSSTNNLNDLSTLLSIKSFITFDPKNALSTSWSPNTSLCKWPFITCNLQTQRVTSLNLRRLSFQGSISPHIGNLTFLESLDLSNNSLSGGIPNEIALLPNLKYLNLSVNQLTGPIPSQLFNSSSLNSIVLAMNQLYGEIEDSLHLPQVQLLSLSYNQIGGRVPVSLSRCRKLRTLSISYNQFIGEIPAELGRLVNLRALYLGYNNHTGKIPPSFGNLTELRELGLNHNYLVGEIPDELGSLDKLTLLNLAENGFTGTIPNSILNISSLEKIGLSFNNLHGYLPKDIGFQLPNLQGIYLDDNNFSGEIPSSLSNASMLSVIELSDNQFNGSNPETLGDLKFLQTLSVQGNQLKNGLKFIKSLTKCRFLENLLIGENDFGGQIPESIGNLSTNLIRFRASNCQLTGRTPDSIGNLSGLIYLNLHDNLLTGELPKAIGNLEGLQMTYLYSNEFQGSLPYEICNLRALSFLSIYNNALSGRIPDCIGNMSALQRLSLADNSFSSTIPSSIWRLNNLIFLNLSQNSLVGALSSDVGNLKSLGQLDVSMNQLSGTIPSVVGNLQMLKFLVLSQNSFSGQIPQSFGKLINMEGMDLSSNLLTGTIPNSLANLSYFTFLNISFNMLEGEVPSGGVFSNLTFESFMGNKALCGNRRLGLPTCNTDTQSVRNTKSRTRLLIYILPVIALMLVLSTISLCLFLRCKKPKNSLPTNENSAEIDHRMISYHELLRATDDFSEANLLGVGSHGKVYKGRLNDNTVVAIKVLNLQTDGAIKSFNAECQVMRKVRHRNLVKIITTCSNLDFKALVLQFMTNGSLEMWLHSEDCYLSLVQRVSIMLDVALALEYLHHEHCEVVVHCDLKPSNVLLDEDMIAHVADFGVARLLGGDNMSTMHSSAPGTIGYMAPEYGSLGRVSPKADVYSFGILLLEALTGKRPTEEFFAGISTLRKWVNDAFPHSVPEVVETNLFEREVINATEEKYRSIKNQCLSSIIELGLMCSTESVKDRISMKDVTTRLRKIKFNLSI